ncbi:uncharacterized protein J7T54_002638 [Emericellopsis cladophorae]|uniref:Uncharacterized protein n=1 Tax=Emericellopsis cladophorae TaxID=2686198 RepID=A0A9P9XX22_9HYPO|nr:uncharacterized protein J7T54_002638 [Emericellopsis cladophorae]KAI6778995.1 hypothetical protein J7T54_002638 [Emericellopsis cladophorae]
MSIRIAPPQIPHQVEYASDKVNLQWVNSGNEKICSNPNYGMETLSEANQSNPHYITIDGTSTRPLDAYINILVIHTTSTITICMTVINPDIKTHNGQRQQIT